ncbi:MAG: helix-turn-helix domain-containing protein [Acidobacteriaceae bacterium]
MSSHNAVPVRGGVYKLQALDRAFAVLDLLAASNTPLGLAEIADALGLHKSTAHRFLMVLERHRMVERALAGKFRLGLRLCDLGGRATLKGKGPWKSYRSRAPRPAAGTVSA